MLRWLKSFADERGLAWQQDTVGNLVIKRTGTGGGERAPAVVIQVCSLPFMTHHVLRKTAGMMAPSDALGVPCCDHMAIITMLNIKRRVLLTPYVCSCTKSKPITGYNVKLLVTEACHKSTNSPHKGLLLYEGCQNEPSEGTVKGLCMTALPYTPQGHVDMVTEKNNDVDHDFYKDPLRLQSDGTWLKVGPIAHIWVALHCLIGAHAAQSAAQATETMCCGRLTNAPVSLSCLGP